MLPTPYQSRGRLFKKKRKKTGNASDNNQENSGLTNEENGEKVTKADFIKLEVRLSEAEKEIKELKLKVMGNNTRPNQKVTFADATDYVQHIRFTEQSPFISEARHRLFVIGNAIHGEKKRERKEIGVWKGANGVNLRIGEKRLTGERPFMPKGELEDITLHLSRWDPSPELRKNKSKLLKDLRKHVKDEIARLPEVQISKVRGVGNGASKANFSGEDSDDEEEKPPQKAFITEDKKKVPPKVNNNSTKNTSATHSPSKNGRQKKRKQEISDEEQSASKKIKTNELEEMRKGLYKRQDRGHQEKKSKTLEQIRQQIWQRRRLASHPALEVALRAILCVE